MPSKTSAFTSNSLKPAAPLPEATVHWAADAAEARRIILDLLRQENATEVIKIKTMTSAEIQLNPFLQAAGVSVYETDLAEIILQLGEQEPSHIVVPALHVNRSPGARDLRPPHGPQGSLRRPARP